MEDSLPFPSLGDCFGRLTAVGPRSFSPVVLVCDPFFIASHHPLQKWVDFVTFQQRIAGINSSQKVILRQFVWHPYMELLLETSLMQMVPNDFLANLQFLDSTICMILSTFSMISLSEHVSSSTSILPEWKYWNQRFAVAFNTVLGP